MTLLISAIGLVLRFAGALLTTSLGWASTLLFGRVQRSHQVFVVLMLAGALLWMVLVVGAIAPAVPNFVLDITPHPAFVGRELVRIVVLAGVGLLPLGVGLAGYLVPTGGDRATGPALLVELLRGYLLTPILGGLMLFLPAVGISRKARSLRHRWSDTHIAIVAKPDGYEQLAADLQRALDAAGMPVESRDAPAVLSVPALLLTSVAGGNVRKLRPDRLVELVGPRLRIGVYPSDIAVSGPSPDRDRARAAIVSRLATTAAHLTTSAEAQAFEDRLEAVAQRWPGIVPGQPSIVAAEFAALDRALIDLKVTTDEWDILYRLRLQIERDILTGVKPGTALPTDGTAEGTASARASHATAPAGTLSGVVVGEPGVPA